MLFGSRTGRDLFSSVYTVSDKEDSLLAAKTSVMTSVYLADAFSGKRHDRFHLGQTLQLHVDVEGLMSEYTVTSLILAIDFLN